MALLADLAARRAVVRAERLRAVGHPSATGPRIRPVDNEPPVRLVPVPPRSV